MEEKNKKPSISVWLFRVLLLCNIIVTVGLAVYVFTGVGTERKADTDTALSWLYPEGGAYVLYIGLNDKDTYEQIISDEDAEEKMNAIITKHVEGYTVYHARGGWVDENKVLTQENTLVYIFRDTTEEQMRAIMDEALIVLNQNSILIEKQDSPYAFYNGQTP